MLRKGKEVEGLDTSEAEAPFASQRRNLPQQAREPAGQIDESSGRLAQERIEERRIETLARGVDDCHVRAFEHIETIPRRARMDGPPRSNSRGEGSYSGLQPREPSGTPLVEANGLRTLEQPEAYRSDPAVGLSHLKRTRDQRVNAFDRTFEEGEVVLAEGTRRKQDFNAAETFSDVRVP